jgi:hypothetical protein
MGKIFAIFNKILKHCTTKTNLDESILELHCSYSFLSSAIENVLRDVRLKSALSNR